MIHYQAFSRKGSKSPVNQDFFCLPDENPEITRSKGYLFTVCDGLGGHKSGEIASEFCATELQKLYYHNNYSSDKLQLCIQIIHSRMLELAQEKPEYRGMGTTLSALLLTDRNAEFYNVGDSRIYLFSDNGLFQLTEDHSVVWEKYRQRMISKEDILTQPEKNLVTQVIGFLPSCKIFSDSIELPEKFIILICSDGLTDVVPDRKIENLLSRTKNLDNALKSLYQISQNNESRDDVTMILISNFLK